jgi:hypothetical protein
MHHLNLDTSRRSIRLIARSISYAASLAAIFFFLLYCREQNLRSTFLLVAEIGLFLVVLEAFFTVHYVNAHPDKPRHLKEHTFLHHAINHLLYPFIFYIGFVVFIAFEENPLLSSMLGFLSFFMYAAYFYYLPLHIRYDHIDHPQSSHVSAINDFVMYLFKFFSFFVVNLALFQGLAQSRFSTNFIFIVNFALMALYFGFHLNRRDNLSPLNVVMALLFSGITALVILYAKTSVVNFSAAIATLLFYLSSGVFYHKVDGTLNYKILIEYASIAVIASVFLFSI